LKNGNKSNKDIEMSIKLMVMSFGLVLAQFEPDEGINYAAWCLVMMIIFVLSYRAAREKMRQSDWWSGLDDPEECVDEEAYSYGDKPMTEEDWNVICRTAIEEAKNGSASARTWVTKNIAEGGVPSPTTATPTASSKPSSGTTSSGTAPDIIKDVISGLRSAGHTKAEATSRVQQCLAEKVYDNVEDLLRDAFSK